MHERHPRARRWPSPSGRRLCRGAFGALALALSLACAAPKPPPGDESARRAQLQLALETGEELYRSGEYVRAGERFRAAGDLANVLGQPTTARSATAAECTAWLLARCLPELGDCTQRLEWFVRRERSSDPGVNTLLALGAVAGRRSLPSHQMPSAVQELLRATAAEAK